MSLLRGFVVWALLLGPSLSWGQSEGLLQLTLPSQFYAVVGVETKIYFDNIVLTKTPEDYVFDVACEIGAVEPRAWTVTPTSENEGRHQLTVTVRDRVTEKQLARETTQLLVVASDAGADAEARILIIGDSLTHATAYPNELARLLSQPSNPEWRMLGTHKPKSAAKGVAHEGYGGWTWQRFATKYEPNPDGTYRKRSSPFVYLSNDKPVLDFERYWKEQGEQPNFVIIMLGINDCFGATPSSPDDRITAMFGQAKVVLDALRQSAPNTEIGICLTTPPNSREAAFMANYKGRYSRWNWKKIQHRLVQRQMNHFGKSDDTKLFVIPTHLNLDPINGYPENNGVHPNSAGYNQLGASIYAWLKWRLSARN